MFLKLTLVPDERIAEEIGVHASLMDGEKILIKLSEIKNVIQAGENSVINCLGINQIKVKESIDEIMAKFKKALPLDSIK